MPSIGPQTASKYNRESVERALTLHLGPQGQSGKSWLARMNGSYTVDTAIGVINLKTLREAAIFVIGLAEGKRHEDRA